ncbi:uncharacterized protein AKAW2_20074A [Aspergillus luchuensis]|uniref:Uncharacterized protein n=1 Tax=Aspergillus kawachii TaxID=1069201 RepID=A0A7R7ZVV0_ASPKA|nr:uncharacterized protein AKAW2_20074A [Aspergillus luchuensis]BCR95134.1 hypothetical protein AKAW2_20074A [Aspergillus luchuensis]
MSPHTSADWRDNQLKAHWFSSQDKRGDLMILCNRYVTASFLWTEQPRVPNVIATYRCFILCPWRLSLSSSSDP